ncbi:hypothetical protein ACEWY4_007285 [Coilia grayii]|uniref:Cilia- and flagella-associated protein 97 n=1 Tax=Coilia grayii TaxID=363190 RepID=A0ABD1KG79_9TELE
MYSPKELEEGVDHSFFDSDCEDGPSQDCDNAQSKQHSSGSDVVSHGDRYSAELSSTNKEKQNQKKDERVDDSPQVEDAVIDLKEIKDAVSEVKDYSRENKKGGASDSDSSGQNEEEEGTAGPAGGHEMSKSTLVGANVMSKAAHETQVNNGSDGNVYEMKRTDLDAHDGIKKRESALQTASDEEDGSINGGDRSHERSLSKLSGATGSRCSRESPLPSGGENNSAEPEFPPELESEDTVTDVTPLSTPDMSPAQSFDLPVFALEAKEPAAAVAASPPPTAALISEKTKQHNVTIDLNVTADENSTRDDFDDEDIFGLESQASSLNPVVRLEAMDKPRNSDQQGHSRVRAAREHSSVGAGSAQSDVPRGQHRRNYTFRDDEVWRIDRENQRLLRELSRPSSRPRSGNDTNSAYSVSSCSSRRYSGPPPHRLYHSATNRQREQKRIERENLALLKRIETVKPSISRAEQLADYQRQSRYRCAPPIMENYRTALDTSLSRSSQGRSSRPCSASVRPSPRPGSRPSPSPTKPSQDTFPRPAWS